MAIQQINLGSMPLGAGGDTQRAANAKINENFSNSEHAASKLTGVTSGRIPLAQHTRIASESMIGYVEQNNATQARSGSDLDAYEVGDYLGHSMKKYLTTGAPTYGAEGSHWCIRTIAGHKTANYNNGYMFQIAMETLEWGHTEILIRKKTTSWGSWKPINSSKLTYATTTGTAPNVVIGSDGVFMRSSSSEKYKDIIAPLSLDDEDYQKALAVKPIVYRSKAETDPKHWHYMSFSAEELGEYDPCLTQWKTHETNPETGEQVELEEKEAEGINLNAICAVLHATNIKQAELIKSLEDRVAALEAKQ